MNNDQQLRKLACAECRRSKLKCDRSVPCQACVRRGCPSICPDGTLTATKGNKALQARNEKLEEQVQSLKAKLKESQKELAETQQMLRAATAGSPGNISDTPAQIREPDKMTPSLVDAISSMAITEQGTTKFYGSSSSSEFLHNLLPSHSEDHEALFNRQRDPKHLNLPPEVLHLVYAFPLGLRDCPYDASIFVPLIPAIEVARRFISLYYEFATWQFDPYNTEEFHREIFNLIYQPDGEIKLNHNLHPHKLAIFFSTMAYGAFYSRDPGSNTTSVLQERFHAIACGAFAMEPLTKGVTVSTIQALFTLNRFLYYTVWSAYEEYYMLFGITVRASQMMGLQFDGVTWNLDKPEIQRRRLMFWEMYIWDTWSSFMMGRPQMLRLEDSDCKFPDNDVVPGQSPSELGWRAWKFRYTAVFLQPTLRHVFGPSVMTYENLLELDRRIRAHPVPSHLQCPFLGPDCRPWSGNAFNALRQWNALSTKETNLMHLHRSYFAVAIREKPSDPLSHKYGPSVLAAYRCACRLYLALKGLHLVHPKSITHQWYCWSIIYSSCVVLAAMVIGSPACSLAQEAYMELNNAYEFYEIGSVLVRPPETITVLADLKARARAAFQAYHRDPESSADPEPGEVPVPGLCVVGGGHQIFRQKSDSPASSPSSRNKDSPSYRVLATPPPTSSTSPGQNQDDVAAQAQSPVQMPTSSMRTEIESDERSNPSGSSLWFTPSVDPVSPFTSSTLHMPYHGEFAGFNSRATSRTFYETQSTSSSSSLPFSSPTTLNNFESNSAQIGGGFGEYSSSFAGIPESNMAGIESSGGGQQQQSQNGYNMNPQQLNGAGSTIGTSNPGELGQINGIWTSFIEGLITGGDLGLRQDVSSSNVLILWVLVES
ncbi:fungal-specific transcription factor domain-containing protein [Abortiporus biennis]|nr:fungal-specific transcription factor domain-containing protein [Abortiporus biennis]